MKYIYLVSICIIPVTVSAQATLDSSVIQLVNNFVDVIINPLILLLISAALLLFFWGLFRLLWDLSNGGTGAEGKQHILWGLIGLVIMISVWGIIELIANSIGSDTTVNVEQL
jgi:succinate dehydrogenase/fumarate reductase cytochrome b subunit